jgi:hypothetical protein
MQPVIPPAPLTGDVGRDCGDASRALLFCREFEEIACFRPTNRPTAAGVVARALGLASCGQRPMKNADDPIPADAISIRDAFIIVFQTITPD